MDRIETHKKLPFLLLTALTVAVLITLLLIGLKPRDFFARNHVTHIPDQAGVRFGKYGIAFTDSISEVLGKAARGQREFSVEIALKSESYAAEGFNFVCLFYGGRDQDQLVIAQWASSLIVMNGDDYSHRKKTKRITVKALSRTPEPQFVTLTTGADGTKIYLNGRIAATRKDLTLSLPADEPMQLILGNSALGKHPWEGEIYGLSVFGQCLSEQDAELHYQKWTQHQTFSFMRDFSPLLSYPFDETKGAEAKNSIGTGHDLHIPVKFRSLYPRFFLRNWNGADLSKNLTLDAFLNFFGFIPFGMVFAATMIQLGGKKEAHSLSIAIGAGFFVSATIEIIQAWMPARSSDLQDLILNTVGMLAGAMAASFLLPHSSDSAASTGHFKQRILGRF